MFNLFKKNQNIEATISHILGLSGILANTLGLFVTLTDNVPQSGVIATLGCLIFLVFYSYIAWSNPKFLNSYNFIVTFLSTNIAFPIIFFTTKGVSGAFIFYFFIAASAYGAIIIKKWQLVFPIATLIEYYFVIKVAYRIESMNSGMWLNFRSLYLAFATSYIFLFIFTYFFSYATRKYFSKTEKLAFRDGLTNIYNRRKLDQELEEGEYRFGAMMDIDDFHLVNNQYGHQFGDAVLQILAKICLATSSDEFKIYRYGGEEFFILSRLSKEKTLKKLKEIQSAFYQETDCTISIGVTEKLDYEPYRNLIKKADRNMYFVKNNGKNNISFNGSELLKS